MYDKSTMIDTLFDTLYDTWDDTQVHADGDEVADIEKLIAAVNGGTDDIEGAVSYFAYCTERRAARRAFTAGFRAARELITGMPCGKAFT